jgi:hypothetical protein
VATEHDLLSFNDTAIVCRLHRDASCNIELGIPDDGGEQRGVEDEQLSCIVANECTLRECSVAAVSSESAEVMSMYRALSYCDTYHPRSPRYGPM